MNICRFVPSGSAPDVITPIHFVYETNIRMLDRPFNFSFYRVGLITQGSAEIASSYGTETISENDVFFLFPAVEYQITCSGDFRYLYIDYIGIRANMVMERLKITKKSCIFRGLSELRAYWETSITCRAELLDLASESVLLYTFSAIGSIVFAVEPSTAVSAPEPFLYIKKYIDEHFADPELSLELLSNQFGYHEKYISYGFKKQFQIGVNAYINTQRINYAAALMDQNHTFVKDIAVQSGFRDQLYFSRVFKKCVGVSPREYMQQKAAR